MQSEDLGDVYEMRCQSRFDARYWMLGAGALGRPRGMEWGGRTRWTFVGKIMSLLLNMLSRLVITRSKRLLISGTKIEI